MIRRKIVWSLAVLLAGVLTAFVAANVLDYYRFHRAISRLENLSEAQVRALGDAAARVEQVSRTDRADGFEALHPVSAVLYPGSSDFLLYELRTFRPLDPDNFIYVYARISSSPHNQEIGYFTNSEGIQRTKILWNRNPEFVARLSPANRILTVRQWDRGSRTWIILSDRLL